MKNKFKNNNVLLTLIQIIDEKDKIFRGMSDEEPKGKRDVVFTFPLYRLPSFSYLSFLLLLDGVVFPSPDAFSSLFSPFFFFNYLISTKQPNKNLLTLTLSKSLPLK